MENRKLTLINFAPNQYLVVDAETNRTECTVMVMSDRNVVTFSGLTTLTEAELMKIAKEGIEHLKPKEE